LPWDCEAGGDNFQGVDVPCLLCDGGPLVDFECEVDSDCWICVPIEKMIASRIRRSSSVRNWWASSVR